MAITQRLSAATPDTIRHELLQTVEHLLRAIRRCQDVVGDIQRVRDLLDALPLATSDYGTATNRLHNAYRYLVSREHDAARYELQLLVGSLRNGHGPDIAPKSPARRVAV